MSFIDMSYLFQHIKAVALSGRMLAECGPKKDIKNERKKEMEWVMGGGKDR